ncbi:MAG: aldo/keto reductase [Epsilonproteobacteria bacterium]|nr:aldo/keto reductase [Campylobacterota bacterium]
MKPEKIGYGTYRITDTNQTHEAALSHALRRGICVIDTSSNYTDTHAETLIGNVIQSFSRQELQIVSKFGYIQGQNMKCYRDGMEIEDVVRYQEGCYHSIHPDFMRDQLTQSLQRLQTDYLDTYLLHNPEYYLMYTVKNESDKKQHQTIMMERIYGAFVALEQEVKKGRIKAYGVSSNSFAKVVDDLHFLPYTDLVNLAQKAAQEAENSQHHFQVVQLPINLFETEGLKCAKWAKAEGLRVFVNRPLNAFDGKSMHRLASYAPNKAYAEDLENILLVADQYALSELRSVIMDLDNMKTKFSWIGSAEQIVYTKAVPFLKSIFQRLDKDLQLSVRKSVDIFLASYFKEVKYLCSLKTKEMLSERGVEIGEVLSCSALNWLAGHEEIDVILVGMRTQSYVDTVLDC